MTLEEKELLLKDLCGRLPYSLKCCDFCYNNDGDIVNTIETLECIYPSTMEYKYKDVDAKHDIKRIKPYLRPMSSMTEEEFDEIKRRWVFTEDCRDENDLMDVINRGTIDTFDAYSFIDWLNKKYFDYRGLIPMGLALEATEGMYNTKAE